MTAIKCENCGHVQRILRRNTEVTQCSKCHKKIWVKASITKEPLTRNFTYLTKSKYAFNVRCWNCGKGFNPKNLRDARIEVVCPMCRKVLSEAVCLKAVESDGYALRYVKEQSVFEKITGLKLTKKKVLNDE